MVGQVALGRKRERQEREGLYSLNRRLEQLMNKEAYANKQQGEETLAFTPVSVQIEKSPVKSVPVFDGSKAEDWVARVEENQPKKKSEELSLVKNLSFGTKVNISRGCEDETKQGEVEKDEYARQLFDEMTLVKVTKPTEELNDPIDTDVLARNEAIGVEESSKVIETSPFQTQSWKPPEERNESMMLRVEQFMFDGGNTGSWVSRVEHYYEKGKFTEEEFLGFVKTKKRHEEEEEKQTNTDEDKHACQVFDEMILGEKRVMRKRKKRIFTKYKSVEGETNTIEFVRVFRRKLRSLS